MSLSRFVEISKSEGLSVAIHKALKFGPIIIIKNFGQAIFDINSTAYWNYRLLLNWSNAGGPEQTRNFAESFFEHVDFADIEFNSVIDFGCALGDSSSAFRSHNKNLDIYLWDVSSVGLKSAVRRNKKYGAKKWDRNTKADMVYCSNVVEHIPDTSSLITELCRASNQWVCIQGPYNEKHDDGTSLTPENPNGEHVWTIDDAFINKNFALPIFEKCATFIGDAPIGWPFGKQFYFIGKLWR